MPSRLPQRDWRKGRQASVPMCAQSVHEGCTVDAEFGQGHHYGAHPADAAGECWTCASDVAHTVTVDLRHKLEVSASHGDGPRPALTVSGARPYGSFTWYSKMQQLGVTRGRGSCLGRGQHGNRLPSRVWSRRHGIQTLRAQASSRTQPKRDVPAPRCCKLTPHLRPRKQAVRPPRLDGSR